MAHLQDAKIKIAYLAPEIPALSATFVYEELHALERHGYEVIPISVRRPGMLAQGQEVLNSRVHFLYESGPLRIILAGLWGLIAFKPAAILQALGWLASDIRECGLFKLASWKLAYQFFAAVTVARILLRERCEHLHAHFAFVPAQIAMYASALSGVPFTVTAHANDIFERGQLLKQKAARSSKFLTISEYNRRYLEGLGLPADKLAVVRCGVSFQMKPASGLDWFGRDFRIGTLGRLVEKKGVDVLLHAVTQLKNKGLRVQLDIAGDGPLRQELESLCADLHLGSEVSFLGSLDHHHVEKWMADLDVFVLACKMDKNGDMDGIPVVLMEAMSQGVPVISTDLSGIPELVMDMETGLLAIPNDSASLADKIELMMSSDELRCNLVEKAQKHVVGEFGQLVNIDRLAGYFRH